MPHAIDPFDCGCTDCVLNDSVPLRNATGEHIIRMLTTSLIRNNTGLGFRINVTYTVPKGSLIHGAQLDQLTITPVVEDWTPNRDQISALTWDVDTNSVQTMSLCPR